MKRSEASFFPERVQDVSTSLPTLDPSWETVTTLFPGHTGMKILLAILASAEVMQQTLPTWGLVDVAILNCRNLAAFAQQVGCGKDTLLRYVKIYQVLGLLTHTRIWRHQRSLTELTLPLTPYHPSSEILERLNTLVSQGRKKQQELARFVRDRYMLLYRLSLHPQQETQVTEHPLGGLLTRAAHLLQKKRVRRIDRQMLHTEITEVLAQMETAPLGDPLSLWQNQAVYQEVRSIGNEGERKDLVPTKGDLLMIEVTQLEDLACEEGDLLSTRGDQSSLAVTKSGDVGYDAGELVLPHGDLFAPDSQKRVEMGDIQVSDVAPSNIGAAFLQHASPQKTFNLESKFGEQWTGSEEDLSQEAAQYLALLDGSEYATPEYLNTHAGKKALGGYKNKIRRSPRLARLAAINTLLQRTFYDLSKQKKPLESAGRWFHSSFDRYADSVRPMEMTGEILDWAKSPFTLEEIALILPLERQRQEAQWWPPQPLHYPFASCVARYHQVPNAVSDPQRDHPEENGDGSSLAGTQMNAEGVLRPSALQVMSPLEAEQVAIEIRQEASWYLYDIHVRASQEGENISVVEAYLVDSVFLVTYRTRQEWWLHHQEQLRHEEWQQKRKGRTRERCPS